MMALSRSPLSYRIMATSDSELFGALVYRKWWMPTGVRKKSKHAAACQPSPQRYVSVFGCRGCLHERSEHPAWVLVCRGRLRRTVTRTVRLVGLPRHPDESAPP